MSVSQAVVSLSAQQAEVLGLLLPHLAGMAVDRAEDRAGTWWHLGACGGGRGGVPGLRGLVHGGAGPVCAAAA